MFTHFTNQQSLADDLKHQCDGSHAVLDLIQRFEASPWIPLAFEDALKATLPSGDAVGTGFTLSDDNHLILNVWQPTMAIIAVLALYLLAVETVQSSRVYSTEEAAAFLGITVRAIKKYIYENKTLHGEVKGNSLIFTHAELQAFAARRRRAGRPRSDKTIREGDLVYLDKDGNPTRFPDAGEDTL